MYREESVGQHSWEIGEFSSGLAVMLNLAVSALPKFHIFDFFLFSCMTFRSVWLD